MIRFQVWECLSARFIYKKGELMKKIVLSFAAVVALASVAQAEDSCHVMNAPEGQKLACVQAKFEGKVAQMHKFASDINAQIEKLSNERDANDNDKAERAQRIANLKQALKGLVEEVKEKREEALAAAHTIAQSSRELVGRADDKDAEERAARLAKAKEMYACFVAEIRETTMKVVNGVKAMWTRITTDDMD